VVSPGSIRQPEGVGFRADEPAGGQVLDRVLDQRPPDVELLDVEAIQLAELVVRRFEEGPLIAFEIDRDGERQDGARLEAQRLQHLDPDVDVTVLFYPDTT